MTLAELRTLLEEAIYKPPWAWVRRHDHITGGERIMLVQGAMPKRTPPIDWFRNRIVASRGFTTGADAALAVAAVNALPALLDVAEAAQRSTLNATALMSYAESGWRARGFDSECRGPTDALTVAYDTNAAMRLALKQVEDA